MLHAFLGPVSERNPWPHSQRLARSSTGITSAETDGSNARHKTNEGIRSAFSPSDRTSWALMDRLGTTVALALDTDFRIYR